jgi:hypothetical protein
MRQSRFRQARALRPGSQRFERFCHSAAALLAPE